MLALIIPGAAAADTAVSSNWAGYVAHRSGVRFRTVSARWRVPAVNCRSTSPGFSSMWVGIGGFDSSSSGLEQAGTESDCSAAGQAQYTAWYELLPASARTIGLRVRAGDLIGASVNVSGHRVTVVIDDLTTHRRFARALTASVLDTTSADWILEAPSACDSGGQCRTLPLADVGRAGFGSARAVTLGGHTGTVSGPRWGRTRLVLAAGGVRFAGAGSSSSSAQAVPSALTGAGSAFTVSYQASSTPSGGTYFSARAAVSARRVVSAFKPRSG